MLEGRCEEVMKNFNEAYEELDAVEYHHSIVFIREAKGVRQRIL